MNSSIIKHIYRFLILVLTQVLILNNVFFLGYINPYIYILFIMLLPFNTAKWLLLILSFGLGICVDAFQNSIGIHTFSCVLIAYFRTNILNVLLPQLKSKKQTNLEFSLQEFGFQRAFIYTGSMVLIHHFTLFSLESFRPELISIFLRTVSSSIVSVLLLIIIQYFMFKDTKR